jgi:hypothetical protein
MRTDTRTIATASVVMALAAWTAGPVRAQETDAPEGVEVLARGPVHEAYATPAGDRPAPAEVAPRRPPEPVEELPPDQRPEGDNVQWIPGYWAWDAEANDFLWVSGVWRDVPPGRAWVPGHWREVEGGWQWVPGFWADESLTKIEYLPEPPESLEAGPATPPAEGQVYVPGCWVWRESRYLWRPGLVIAHRPGWLWVPARYVWAPGGCVFIDGYWDYPLHDRGLLFAPVRFARGVAARTAFRYVPRYVVREDFLVGALFVNTTTRQYVFGDYFGDRSARGRYVPFFEDRVARLASADPIFHYYRTEYRLGGRGVLQRDDRARVWEAGLRGLYDARFKGTVAPPPRTLTQQPQAVQAVANQAVNVSGVTNALNAARNDPGAANAVNSVTNITNVRNVTTALAALGELPGVNRQLRRQSEDQALRLRAIEGEQRQQQEQSVRQARQFAEERRKLESRFTAREAPRQPASVDLNLRQRAARPAAPAPTERRPGVPAAPRTPPPPPQVPRAQERPPAETPRPQPRPDRPDQPKGTRPEQPRPPQATPPREPAPRPQPPPDQPKGTRPETPRPPQPAPQPPAAPRPPQPAPTPPPAPRPPTPPQTAPPRPPQNPPATPPRPDTPKK